MTQDVIINGEEMHPVSIRDPISNNGNVEVEIQDQYSETFDLYACKLNGTTNPTTGISVDDKTITVDSATGAVVGDCINIKEDSHTFQSVISNITDTTITFTSPSDYAFTTSAIVCFGEWDLSTANGSSTPVSFFVCPPTGTKYDITAISISMEDDAVMYESTFGGITALTNGFVGRVTDGISKNMFLVTNNGGFREQGFETEYPTKVPSGTYAFWANKTIKEINGVVIRLDGDSEDKIEIIVQDDLTAIGKIAVTIHGHVVE